MKHKLLKGALAVSMAVAFASNAYASDLPRTSLVKQKVDIDWIGNEDWMPEDSIENEINKASVDKVDRSQGSIVNPLASEEGKIQVLSLMNKKGEGTTTVGGPEFKAYTFDFWQYVDSMIFWDGPIPTPDVIDAAHRNGVAIYGTLFFNWSTSTEDNERFKNFITEDSPGSNTFPSARTLAKAAKYYGFDGYFINQETVGSETYGKADKMIALMHYMKDYAKDELDYDIRLSWYDAMANSGGRNHVNGVSRANHLYVEPRSDGQVPADEFFMNFNWSNSSINTTRDVMNEIGRSPYDAYAGFELQAGSYNTIIRRNELVGSDNKLRTSIGLFTPDSIQGLSLDGEDYHEQERKFWTGFGGDPTTSDDSNRWSGMARFVRDSTPITSLPFNTFFNTGHGKGYFIDGNLSKKDTWNQRSVQEILPTWRWWVRSTTDSKISPRFDFDDAYNGPNSIAFEGNLESGSTNDVMLYSTDVNLSDASKLVVSHKAGANSTVRIGLSDDVNYSEDSFTYYELDTTSQDWLTETFDISNLAGKNIRAIKLQFVNDEVINDYKFNLGQLAIIDDESQIQAPSNIEVLDKIVHTAESAEAIIKFDRVPDAAYYEVFQNVGGIEEHLTSSSSNYVYLDRLKRAEGNQGTSQEIYVRAVGKNGTRSEKIPASIDYEMDISDTDPVAEESENVVIGASVLGVNAENPGELGRNALSGTISGNSDKWCNNYSNGSWLEIELTEPRTVRRWVMDHAGAGGEDPYDPATGKGGSMNTKNFKISYKVNPDDPWTELKAITNNKLNVTDISFDNDIEAKYYRLDISQAHNGTPWGATRIYNWKMYETKEDKATSPIPMPYVKATNTRNDLYDITFAEIPANTTVKLFADRELTKELASFDSKEKAAHTFNDIKLPDNKGIIYYQSRENGKDPSPVMAIVYKANESNLESIAIKKAPNTIYAQGEDLDLRGASLEATFANGSKDEISMDNENVIVDGYDPNTLGKQVLTIKYLDKETSLEVEVKSLDDLKSTIKAIELPADFKTTYEIGEDLDMDTKLKVTFYRGNPIELVLSDENVKVEGFDSSKEITGELVITYKDKSIKTKYSVVKPVINYQRLEQKIADVEGVLKTDDNLTPASKAKLEKTLEDAKKLLNNANSQDQVDQMVTKLDQDLKSLTSKANKEKLDKLINQANEKAKGNYTKESLDNLKRKIDQAQKIYDDENISQTEVNKISTDLARAMFSLKKEKAFDKKELDKEVKEAEAKLEDIKNRSYTEESIKAYEKALQAAKEALENNVNKEVYDKALKDLKDASLKLEVKSKANKAKLKNLIAKADRYDLSKFKDKNKINTFKNDLNKAKEVLKDKSSSQKEVDQAYSKLLRSMFGLR